MQQVSWSETEIQEISLIDWQGNPWKRTTLLTDRAVQFATAKTYVLSDSVLCMGGISAKSRKRMEGKIVSFMNSSQYRQLDRIDGEPMELEWKISKDSHALRILAEIQNMMTEIQCEPEQFPGRIIFMSMYNDTALGEHGNEE